MSSTTADVATGGGDLSATPAERTADGGKDELAERTSRLRLRKQIPLDRWLQTAGGILLPLGILIIIVGWYGAAHTTRVWKQTPYLLSGGLLGVGLIIAGGFCYFAWWLTKLVEDGREQAAKAAVTAERAAAALERIEAVLRRDAGLDDTATLVVTATGTMAHRPGCAVLIGKDGLRNVRPDEPGLKGCLICEPDLAPPVDGGGSGGRRRTPARG